MKQFKQIERSIKNLFFAPKILLRYGTLRPNMVKIVGCDHWIHIDPNDGRAMKKIVYDSIRRRTSPPLAYWRDFLTKLSPAVAVDVGVNYGECLFGARYEAFTQVFGFEANPKLLTYLQKSRESHPDGSNINLVPGLVSDKTDEKVKFYSNPTGVEQAPLFQHSIQVIIS